MQVDYERSRADYVRAVPAELKARVAAAVRPEVDRDVAPQRFVQVLCALQAQLGESCKRLGCTEPLWLEQNARSCLLSYLDHLRGCVRHPLRDTLTTFGVLAQPTHALTAAGAEDFYEPFCFATTTTRPLDAVLTDLHHELVALSTTLQTYLPLRRHLQRRARAALADAPGLEGWDVERVEIGHFPLEGDARHRGVIADAVALNDAIVRRDADTERTTATLTVPQHGMLTRDTRADDRATHDARVIRATLRLGIHVFARRKAVAGGAVATGAAAGGAAATGAVAGGAVAGVGIGGGREGSGADAAGADGRVLITYDYTPFVWRVDLPSSSCYAIFRAPGLAMPVQPKQCTVTTLAPAQWALYDAEDPETLPRAAVWLAIDALSRGKDADAATTALLRALPDGLALAPLLTTAGAAAAVEGLRGRREVPLEALRRLDVGVGGAACVRGRRRDGGATLTLEAPFLSQGRWCVLEPDSTAWTHRALVPAIHAHAAMRAFAHAVAVSRALDRAGLVDVPYVSTDAVHNTFY